MRAWRKAGYLTDVSEGQTDIQKQIKKASFNMSDFTYESFLSIYGDIFAKCPDFFTSKPDFFLCDEVLPKLWRICDRLIDNSKKFNLTSILDPYEIVLKHIVDSLLPLALLFDKNIYPSSLLDVGCGAGFPLLPMSAVLSSEKCFSSDTKTENKKFVGLDSTGKKISHVEESADYAGISHLSGVNGRAEELSHTKLREKFDVVTARAVAALPILVELCAPFVSVGGVFAALKSHVDEELPDADRAAKALSLTRDSVCGYELPDGAKRCLVIYRKISKTPTIYPRRYNEILKHPIR